MVTSADHEIEIETGERKREGIRRRTEDLAVSLKYTYDQHYCAANFYGYLNIGMTVTAGILGAFLTIGLLWETIATGWMIVGAISVGCIEGIRLSLSPGERARILRQSAHDYQALFERSVDFLRLEANRDDTAVDTLAEKYLDLNSERLELNEENPDVSSIWYQYIKLLRPAGGLDQTTASHAERQTINRGN